MDISVIIPCYNCQDTIRETLDSLQSSAYHDFEVLCIDDGSTDGTHALIEAYAAQSGLRLRLLRQENAGVSTARNRGIEQAEGDYLLFLDADDLFAPNYPEAVARVMKAHAPDTMACLRTRQREALAAVDPAALPLKDSAACTLLERYTYSKRTIGFTAFVYRRSILQAHAIRFTPGCRFGEDVEFLTKYLAHCQTAVELESACYYYRPRGTSATHTVSPHLFDLIGCAARASAYLTALDHPFAPRFAAYMPNRALFTVAHHFAKGRDKALFAQLQREYPVYDAMRFISRDFASDWKSRLAAYAYRLSPRAFYRIAAL